MDEYFFIATSWEDENNLRCDCVSNEGYKEFTKVLEKVFKEEFYYMCSDSFSWDTKAQDVKDLNLKIFIKKHFVSSEIYSSDNDNILSVTTKGAEKIELDHEVREKKRISGTVLRIVRDSKISNSIKQLYNTSVKYVLQVSKLNMVIILRVLILNH